MEINSIYHGDCLQVMRSWPDECIDCCVTSPPYWGLRDYGTASWEGGDPECDHSIERKSSSKQSRGSQASKQSKENSLIRHECHRCGARRVDHQLGLETTPAEFIAKMVEVFEEVRRLLKPEGTCWLNIGDSYATGQGSVGDRPGGGKQGDNFRKEFKRPGGQPNRMPLEGFKPKDLCMMPARLAIALQEAGWYLRSEIVWSKPNPMPESAKDRPTSAYEEIFLLTKSGHYHYDGDAIAELTTWAVETCKMPDGWDTGAGSHGSIHRNGREKGKRNRGSRKSFRGGGNYTHRSAEDPECLKPNDSVGNQRTDSRKRNARNVWSIPVSKYSEAHFATFPAELPKKCILAGCPEGGIVLDPFFGTGTTGMVAQQLGRQWIGIELSEKYIRMAKKRTRQRGLFTSV